LDYLGGVSKCNYKWHCKKEVKGYLSSRRKDIVMMKAVIGVMCFEDGPRVTSQEI
jgi:hypothetical protein